MTASAWVSLDARAMLDLILCSAPTTTAGAPPTIFHRKSLSFNISAILSTITSCRPISLVIQRRWSHTFVINLFIRRMWYKQAGCQNRLERNAWQAGCSLLDGIGNVERGCCRDLAGNGMAYL